MEWCRWVTWKFRLSLDSSPSQFRREKFLNWYCDRRRLTILLRTYQRFLFLVGLGWFRVHSRASSCGQSQHRLERARNAWIRSTKMGHEDGMGVWEASRGVDQVARSLLVWVWVHQLWNCINREFVSCI